MHPFLSYLMLPKVKITPFNKNITRRFTSPELWLRDLLTD